MANRFLRLAAIPFFQKSNTPKDFFNCKDRVVFFAKSTQKISTLSSLQSKIFRACLGHTPDIRKNGDLYIGVCLFIVARKTVNVPTEIFSCPRKIGRNKTTPLNQKNGGEKHFREAEILCRESRFIVRACISKLLEVWAIAFFAIALAFNIFCKWNLTVK